MTNVHEILKKLEALKPELRRRYKVREIGLFGSWARGDQHKKSDMDVLVDFEAGADLFDWIGAMLYLEEHLGCVVDMVPRRALRPELRTVVLKQLVKV